MWNSEEKLTNFLEEVLLSILEPIEPSAQRQAGGFERFRLVKMQNVEWPKFQSCLLWVMGYEKQLGNLHGPTQDLLL